MNILVLMIQRVVSAINSCNIHKAVDCDHDRNTECLEASHFTLILDNGKCLPRLRTKSHKIYFVQVYKF